jgi:hypothetical protein
MMVLNATAFVWVIGPVIFCPEPTWVSIQEDLSEFWGFCIGTGQSGVSERLSDTKSVNLEDKLAADYGDARANMYDVWLKDELAHKRTPMFARALELFAKTVRFLVFLSFAYAIMIDSVKEVLLLFMGNYFILTLWRLFGRPSVLLMLSFIVWVVVLIVLLRHPEDSGSMLMAFLLFFEALSCCQSALLLIVWMILRPDPNCTAMPEDSSTEHSRKARKVKNVQRYDAVVEYCYLHSMTYQLHLYAGILILLVDLAVQTLLCLLEIFGGIHSWWLLNGNLRGGFCQTKRPEYKPPASSQEESSTGQTTIKSARLKPLVPQQTQMPQMIQMTTASASAVARATALGPPSRPRPTRPAACTPAAARPGLGKSAKAVGPLGTTPVVCAPARPMTLGGSSASASAGVKKRPGFSEDDDSLGLDSSS